MLTDVLAFSDFFKYFFCPIFLGFFWWIKIIVVHVLSYWPTAGQAFLSSVGFKINNLIQQILHKKNNPKEFGAKPLLNFT